MKVSPSASAGAAGRAGITGRAGFGGAEAVGLVLGVDWGCR